MTKTDDGLITPTQRVVDSSFDNQTKIILLRALMSSECRDCAREAHKAMHKVEDAVEAGCGG